MTFRGLAVHQACGTRARYSAGCRCDACRAANTAYEKQRAQARKAGDWNGVVDATRAREHLLELRDAGVGRRTVHKLTGIATSSLQAIAAGEKRKIRARTERRILLVTLGQ